MHKKDICLSCSFLRHCGEEFLQTVGVMEVTGIEIALL